MKNKQIHPFYVNLIFGTSHVSPNFVVAYKILRLSIIAPTQAHTSHTNTSHTFSIANHKTKVPNSQTLSQPTMLTARREYSTVPMLTCYN